LFAEEFVVLDAESPLWVAARPLLDVALRLDQQGDAYLWHGWQKSYLETFLHGLPAHCSLLVGVWQAGEDASVQAEELVLGSICEVKEGEVCTLQTFTALSDPSLPPVQQLEPGYQHAFGLMRVVSSQVAPVAWALFTDKHTWDEWLFAEGEGEQHVDKGETLLTFAREGRCVLLGSQATHQHHHV
jgi:hypothetical protein